MMVELAQYKQTLLNLENKGKRVSPIELDSLGVSPQLLEKTAGEKGKRPILTFASPMVGLVYF